eukprot:PhM_4_TR10357/c5_g1_i1/m.80280/K18764/CCRN4L; nocturnin
MSAHLAPERSESPTRKPRARPVTIARLSQDALTTSASDDMRPPSDEPLVARRDMFVINDAARQRASIHNNVVVMSYNVLAPKYLLSEKYMQCPDWATQKEYRMKSVAKEVKLYRPDVVCFQELTKECKQDYLDDYLKKNYDSCELLQVLSKTVSLSDNGEEMRRSKTDSSVEGVCIYYNKHRFDLVDTLEIRLDDIPFAGRLYTPSSHNVAVCLTLRSKEHPRSVLLACTVHLYYGWDKPEVQVGQLRRINEALTKCHDALVAQGSDVAVVFAGDLNSEPSTNPIRTLYSEAMHGALEWAYEPYFSKNPTHVTAISQSFRGIIDYIWHERDVFDVAEVVETICTMTKGRDGQTDLLIPTAEYPSDHLPVVASLVSKSMLF